MAVAEDLRKTIPFRILADSIELLRHMQRDSSHSRIYLSSKNNRFQKPHEVTADPRILADIRKRNDQLKERKRPLPAVPNLLRSLGNKSQTTSPTSALETAVIEEGTMAALDVVDVNADPESSEEDEPYQIASTKNVSLPTPSNTQTSNKKRALAESNGNSTGNRRSKRAKLDGQEESSLPQPLSASQMSAMSGSQGSELFLSQSSQKKRSLKYGKNGNRNKPSIWQPDSVEEPEAKSAVALSVPDSVPSTPASRASKRGTNKLELPKSSPTPVASAKLFLPTIDETQHGINTTIGDEIRATSSRLRRDSSSSLSSADSLASIQLDKETKRRLNNDVEGEKSRSSTAKGYVHCLRCKRDTLRAGLQSLKGKKDVSKLSHKDSQKFCYEHRMRDAKQVWKDNHYPDSDLDALTSTTRIGKYLGNLVPIIQRKQKSWYLDKLDEAIANAKGNQRKVNHFFQTDVMTFTHHGYYGPRGAKKLALAIAADDKITKQFRRAEKTDKAFRSANLARAVDSILLPELLVMLVQDDMYLTHDDDGEAQARKVLEDSEDIGILINGDDNDEVDDTKESEDVV